MGFIGTAIALSISTGLILWSGRHFLLVYALVFGASIIALNLQSTYRESARHRACNAVFIGFLAFYVLVRTRFFPIHADLLELINTMEHGLFAAALCLNLLCWAELRTTWPRWTRLLVVLVVFNLFGLGNELYQNALLGRPILLLGPDAVKDVVVNAVGSVLFLGVGLKAPQGIITPRAEVA